MPNVKPKADTRRIDHKDGNHRYVLDGEPCPGVTTIIGDGYPKPWLGPWSANQVAQYVTDRMVTRTDGSMDVSRLVDDLEAMALTGKYPKAIKRTSPVDLYGVLRRVQYVTRDAAAVRGNLIHKIVATWLTGEPVEFTEAEALHVESFLRWAEVWNPTDELVETTVIKRVGFRYAGTFDLVATLADGHRWLLDTKTGTRIYPEVALQLAAYADADAYLLDGTERPMAELGIEGWGVIHLRADGYSFHGVKATGALQAFHAAYRVARWSEERADEAILPEYEMSE